MKMMELMEKLDRNPYHPVRLRDYPRIFNFKITRSGIVYFERLQKELELGNELSDRENLYLGMLHLGYAMSASSPEECKKWQAFMFVIGDNADAEVPDIENTLAQMGCIEENPQYNPKLYKAHLAWKRAILDDVDSM